MKIELLFGFFPILVIYTNNYACNIGIIVCVKTAHSDKELQKQLVYSREMIKFPIGYHYRYRKQPQYRLELELSRAAIDVAFYPPCKHVTELYKRAEYIYAYHNLQKTYSKHFITGSLFAKMGIPYIRPGNTVNT